MKVRDALEMLSIVRKEGCAVAQSYAGNLQIQIGYNTTRMFKRRLQRAESPGRIIVEWQHEDGRQQRIYGSEVLRCAQRSPSAMSKFANSDCGDSQLFVGRDSALQVKAAT